MAEHQFMRRVAPTAVWALLGLFSGPLLAQADRISGEVDGSHLLKIVGNVNPLATPASDVGAADPAMKLTYVQLMLRSSAAQQTDLSQLLRDQQKPGSPNFRKWLTPEQYSDRFGVSQADITKITGWMRSQGFDVVTVARGRRFIAFSATSQQIRDALKTEIHQYQIDGELHFANATEPAVPAAIQPLVLGFLGLDDFQPKPMLDRKKNLKPLLYDANQNVVGPLDLAIIYDLLPLWQEGVTGSGMSMAVIGRSNVQLSDIALFRSLMGLPAKVPQLLLVPGSTDPGIVSSDEGESELDLEYSGGIAYDAQILFVYSTSILMSASYAIDQALAPVMSLSYGACELDLNSATAAGWQALAQQANAEGMTWVNSAGDAGAAACDQGSAQASHGAAIQLEPGIPEVTGVGGSMFNEAGGNYWDLATTNALSYIPETVWNETGVSGHLSAGGGGYSIFYTRADWQVGPGVPAGNARGAPDVSLNAAVDHDPYFVVHHGGQYQLVGGTSAAAPTFAAMVLLLNQYLGTYGLGNINPSLYWMAQSTRGVFHDITTVGNFVPCVTGSPDCGTLGNFGYNAGPGWDAASGLGSVDANQMFEQWSAGAGSPQIGSVVNGASLTATGLSPGLIFTIFGSALGPTDGLSFELDQNGNVSTYLASINVYVDGTPAPLLYVGPGQINAVAPYEIATRVGQNVSVQVYDGSEASNQLSVPVVSAAPAIFSLGNGQGAILNQDGTVNGPQNPAVRGSYIQIYATGEGQTNPAGVDGQFANESLPGLPRPVAPFSVAIGGVQATYSYAGTAPQSFAGFFQVDALVPAGVASGNQPVILDVGGATSVPLNVVVQ